MPVEYDIRPTPALRANIFSGGMIAGKDGVSVVDAQINEKGELILILTKPITAAAVYVEVGNINAMLETL